MIPRGIALPSGRVVLIIRCKREKGAEAQRAFSGCQLRPEPVSCLAARTISR